MKIKVNRPQVQTENYLYSIARTARMLKIKQSEIEFVMLLDDGRVLVGMWNDRKYLKSWDYKIAFAQERKERAEREDFTITQRLDDESSFTVRNEAKNKAYSLTLYSDSLKCSCPDYEISSQVLSTHQVCCKHGYSLLGHLGFNSLKEYIKYEDKAEIS